MPVSFGYGQIGLRSGRIGVGGGVITRRRVGNASGWSHGGGVDQIGRGRRVDLGGDGVSNGGVGGQVDSVGKVGSGADHAIAEGCAASGAGASPSPGGDLRRDGIADRRAGGVTVAHVTDHDSIGYRQAGNVSG